MKNFLLTTTAKITKRIYPFKGFGRIIKSINYIFLRLGVDPINNAFLKDGTTMIIDLRSFELFSFYLGNYDKKYITDLKKLIKKNSLFIDVGANIGLYSIALAKHIIKNQLRSKVYAFEPLDSNFKRLKKNISLNNLEKYCIPFQIGLSDKKGKAQLTLREDFKAGSLTGNAAIRTSNKFDRGFASETIDLDTLDNFCENLDLNKKSFLIKIDIEGHEDFFLRGAKKFISENKPTIFMEVNKPYYSSRGVNIDLTFKNCIPSNYVILRFCSDSKKWIKTDLNKCKNIDNVFLVDLDYLDEFIELIN